MPVPPEGAFRHEIRVTWGHCDPARIAYTGHIPWWALDAIDAWWQAHLGGDAGWFHLELDRNIGTPFVRLEMDFRSPITPRHPLVCQVWPARLGTKSITFGVAGSQDATLCFDGLFTSVFTVADKFESQPAPPDLRALIEPHLPTES